MASYVDLHVHSNCSDGSDAPESVVRRAAAVGLAAIAITDHDTVAGVEEGARAAREHEIEFMPGVEISASYGRAEVHIVGLGIDVGQPALVEALKALQQARRARIDLMVERLNRAGIHIGRAEIEAHAGGKALGRLHVARALWKRGVTRTVQEGFDKYLKAGRKAYVPNMTLPCRKAIELIHEAGGLAIVAHPGVGPTTRKLLPRLLQLPFDGIEIYHTKHTPGQITEFTHIALERDLLISGGSDCHGGALAQEPDLGKVRVPYHHFQVLLDALRRRLILR